MSVCLDFAGRVRDALPRILELRDQVTLKPDNSPVSEADLLVQRLALEHFAAALPGHTVLSEELAPEKDQEWREEGSYVVLDPIDGTENFVSGLKEWGVGVSIFTAGRHEESCIMLPELQEVLATGQPLRRFRSRIVGLSSSLAWGDLESLPRNGAEFRILGCSMYNLLAVIRGSFRAFENVKGVHCWDILPGLNLALEHGCRAWVDHQPYAGGMLFPTRKYRIRVESGDNP